MALALGVVADWWGYGTMTFPIYPYIYENFVRGHASAFGTAPFYAYLYLPLESPMAPLVLFLLVATLVTWLRRANSVVTWATAPYVALLCITSHKETRFLFPLAPFLPFFVVFALAAEPPRAAGVASALRRLASGRCLQVGYVLNFAALACVLFLPALMDFPLYELLESEAAATPGQLDVVVVHDPEKIPYLRNAGRMRFLEPKNLNWRSNPSAAELQSKRARGEKFLAVVDIPVPLPETGDWIVRHCTFVWSAWPRWLQPYNFIHWQNRATWWQLYRCDGRDDAP
jgi:phosphatidylinositol glycan class B